MIPRVWDEAALADFELPLATAVASPKYPSSTYYYSIPAITIYKSYPSNAPDGMTDAQYVDWLKRQEPEVGFDPAKLHTEQDWIEAGERVFYAPTAFTQTWAPGSGTAARPYYIRSKGRLEKGAVACVNCHSLRLGDGRLVIGAPTGGGMPGRVMTLSSARASTPEEIAVFQRTVRRNFAAPWLSPDPNQQFDLYWPSMTTTRGGQIAREGTSFLSPPPTPNLIGIKDRHYLDHTGLGQHRSIADLMRYAALNTHNASIALLGNYSGFIPGGADFKTLPDPKTLVRYTDEQLYALALFLYSLKEPPNPNRPSELSARGSEIFRREGCAGCHTPPLYTNNALTPALGFQVPDEHRKKYKILPVSIGTDPYLAMKTRRGTGYYKVPSLKGLWYRGPFEHNGSVATLEDWFDPRRLREDYVPTGWKGPQKTRAVKGHEFGLTLSVEDKRALIAFLMTL